MTDDEARADARAGMGWVSWNDDKDYPQWSPTSEPTITLDGDFTVKELLAILHFAPKTAG
jgi:hypothetical protein